MLFKNNPKIGIYPYRYGNETPLLFAVTKENWKLTGFIIKLDVIRHYSIEKLSAVVEKLFEKNRTNIIELLEKSDQGIKDIADFYRAVKLLSQPTSLDLENLKDLLPANRTLLNADILVTAIQNGHFNAAEYFINTPRMLPQSYALVIALNALLAQDKIPLIKQLINQSKLTFNSLSFLESCLKQKKMDYGLFFMICNHTTYDSDPDSDYNIDHKHPYLLAAEYGYFSFIELLLTDPKFKCDKLFETQFKQLYEILFEQNQDNIISLLLKKEPSLQIHINNARRKLLAMTPPIDLAQTILHAHWNVLDYFFAPMKFMEEEEKHSGNMLSKCTPDQLGHVLFF